MTTNSVVTTNESRTTNDNHNTQQATERKRVFGYGKPLVVTKGYYRGKRSNAPFYVDCDTLGKLFFLEDINCERSSAYFHESWLSDRYIDCVMTGT